MGIGEVCKKSVLVGCIERTGYSKRLYYLYYKTIPHVSSRFLTLPGAPPGLIGQSDCGGH